FRVYVVLLFLGYLNMLWAVGFDPAQLVNQMLGPRFSQPWARGKFGGWTELAGEFSELLRYLIPAVAGAVLASPSRFTILQRSVVVLGLLFTFFAGFSSGTRNVFCTYIIIFFTSYILLRPNITWKRVIVLSFVCLALLFAAAYYMLQFRQVGLEAYLNAGGE